MHGNSKGCKGYRRGHDVQDTENDVEHRKKSSNGMKWDIQSAHNEIMGTKGDYEIDLKPLAWSTREERHQQGSREMK